MSSDNKASDPHDPTFVASLPCSNCQRLKAENERLKKATADMQVQVEVLCERDDTLQAENERLTKALSRVHAFYKKDLSMAGRAYAMFMVAGEALAEEVKDE